MQPSSTHPGSSDSRPADPFSAHADPFRTNSNNPPADPFAPSSSPFSNSHPFGAPSGNSHFRGPNNPPSFGASSFGASSFGNPSFGQAAFAPPANNGFQRRPADPFNSDPFAAQPNDTPSGSGHDPFRTSAADPFNRSKRRNDSSRNDPFESSLQHDALGGLPRDPFAPAANQTWDNPSFGNASSSNHGGGERGNGGRPNDPFATRAPHARAGPSDRPPRVLAKAILVRGVPPQLFSESLVMRHFAAIPGVKPLRVTMRGTLSAPEHRRTALVTFATPQEASISMSRGRYFESEPLNLSYYRGTSMGGDRMETQRAPPPPVPESRELLFSYVPMELFSEDAVRHLFNSISGNAVVSVSIRSRPHRGGVKRTAIVTFGDVEAARTALQNLPLYNGDRLQVNYRSKPPHATGGQRADAGEGENGSWNVAGQGTRWKAPSPMESHPMDDVTVDADQDPFEVEEEEMGEDKDGDSYAVQHPHGDVKADEPERVERHMEGNGGKGNRSAVEEQRQSAIARLKKDIAAKEKERQRKRAAKANRSARFEANGQRQPQQSRISDDLARRRASKAVVRKSANTDEGWRRSEKIDIKDAVQLVGTCETMCPAKEIEERILQRDIAVFETVSGRGSDADPSKAVKKYRRSAAISEEPKPEDIRPAPVLLKTMEHLKVICDTEEEPFTEIHNFVRDRTRSLRQDFTYQGVRDDICIKIHEESVRFHILSEHRLTGSDPAMFSSKQNLEQLDKCLISLREMYDLRREQKLPTSANEPEMQAYYMLLQMSGRQTCAQLLKGFSNDVRNSLPIQFVLHVVKSCSDSFWDYAGFFKCLRAAPYLLACMMYSRSHYMRFQAVKIISSSHGSKDVILVSEVTEQLCFDEDEEAIEFCSKLGFGIKDVEKTKGAPLVKAVSMTSRLDADKWAELQPKAPSALVETKSGQCRPSEIIAGALKDDFRLSCLPTYCSRRLLEFKSGKRSEQRSVEFQHEAAPRSSTLAPSLSRLPLSKAVRTTVLPSPTRMAQSQAFRSAVVPSSESLPASKAIKSTLVSSPAIAPPSKAVSLAPVPSVESVLPSKAVKSSLVPSPASLPSAKAITTAPPAETEAPLEEDQTANRPTPSILDRLGSAPSKITEGNKNEIGAGHSESRPLAGETLNTGFQAPSQSALGFPAGQAAKWDPLVPGEVQIVSTPRKVRDLQQNPQRPFSAPKPSEEGTRGGSNKQVSFRVPITESENNQLNPTLANLFGGTVPLSFPGTSSAKPDDRKLPAPPDNAASEEQNRVQREAEMEIRRQAEEHAKKVAIEKERQRLRKAAESIQKSARMERERKLAAARAQLMAEKEAVASQGAFIQLVRDLLREVESINCRLKNVEKDFIALEKEVESSSKLSDRVIYDCRQAQTTMRVVAHEIESHMIQLKHSSPRTDVTKELKRNLDLEFEKLIVYGQELWKKVWELKGLLVVTPSNIPRRVPLQRDEGGRVLKRKMSGVQLDAGSRKKQEKLHHCGSDESVNDPAVRKASAQATVPLLDRVAYSMKDHKLIRMQIAVVRETVCQSCSTRRTQDWLWKQFGSKSHGEIIRISSEVRGQMPCHLSVRRFDFAKSRSNGVPPTASVAIFSLDLSSSNHFEGQCESIKKALTGQEQSKFLDKNILPVMILLLCFDSSPEVKNGSAVRPQEAKSFGEGLVHRGLISKSIPVHIPANVARFGSPSEDFRVAIEVAVRAVASETARRSLILYTTNIGDRAVQVGNSAWIRYLSMGELGAGGSSSHRGVIDSINSAWAGLVELLGEEEARWAEEMSAEKQRMKDIRVGVLRKLRLPLPAEIGTKNSCEYFMRLVALSDIRVPTPERGWMTLPQFCRALGHLMVPLVSHLLGDLGAVFVHLPKARSNNKSANLIGLSGIVCDLDTNDITPPAMIDRAWDGKVIGKEPVFNRRGSGLWKHSHESPLGRGSSGIQSQQDFAEMPRKRLSLECPRASLELTPTAKRRRSSSVIEMTERRDDSDFLTELCEIEEAHQAMLDETIELLRQEQITLASADTPRPRGESTSD